MQEHPIPQDITNYRFHIIGSMTLKQFGMLVLGVIVAFILYNTNLIGIIKWTLIIFSVGLSAATAFVPFEERSLDHWIFTFFSIMYKPTKFYWRRGQYIPDVFTYSTTTTIQVVEQEVDLTSFKKQRIKDYLSSVPEKSSAQSSFSAEETQKMQSILSSFTSAETYAQAPQAVTNSEISIQKPNLEVRVRSMRKKEFVPEVIIFDDAEHKQEHVAIITPQPTQEEYTSVKTAILATDQVAENIVIPEEELIIVNSADTTSQQGAAALSNNPEQLQAAFIKDQTAHTPIASETTTAITQNAELPFPSKPNVPNVLVGMTLTQNNELLTDAIIEVQNTEGSIERAVKTNALGQFFITTPLKPGEYFIIVEKQGYSFAPLKISITNTIIDPIEIRSQN